MLPLIHTFKAVGQPMMLDVGSGAVHALDEMAYDVLTLWNDHSPEEICAALAAKYAPKALEEVIGEVRQLEELGALNAPDDYSDVELHEPGVVKAMCLHAAHDCNLRCKYCFAATGDFCMGERKLLPFEVGKAALDWLVEKSGKRVNLEVDFFGGEPLMNFPVIKQLVAYGRSIEKEKNKHFKFTTTTNCVLMNDEIMDFLNQEMDNVVISLDGRPEVHDRMRPTVNGKGSYDVIMPRFKTAAASRNWDNYYLRGTFTRNNKDFFADIRHMVEEGFDLVSEEPVVADPTEPYAFQPEDLPELFEQYERLARYYVERERAGKPFLFFHFNLDLDRGPCLPKRLSGCGAGHEYMAVAPEGTLYPCHQFVGNPDFAVGNVRDGIKKPEIGLNFRNSHVLTKEKCRNCWARFYCSGGCHANAWNFNRDLRRPYELGCELEKKRLECALWIKVKEAEV